MRELKYLLLPQTMIGGRIEEAVSIEEYRLRLLDPYWVKLRDELVSKGIPMYIAEPALIKAERITSASVAYQ